MTAEYDESPITVREMWNPAVVRARLWDALQLLKDGDATEAECLIEEMYDRITDGLPERAP